MTKIEESKECVISNKEKYKLLIGAKNHHYDNYNKWMTYFYVAIGALFVGYYSIASSDKKIADRQLLEYSIMILGYIVSILWYWSCKGYYFWNLNFIYLIHYYEKEILKFPDKEGVYNLFFSKSDKYNNYMNPLKSANVSTSKVAMLFAFIVSLFLGFLLIYKFFDQFLCISNVQYAFVLISLTISFGGIIIASDLFAKHVKSIIDNMPNAEIE